MDLVELLSAVWRTKWIALAVAVIAAGLVGVQSFQKPTTYKAEAVLVVGNLGSGTTLGRTGGEDKLATSFGELVNTPGVLEKAAENSDAGLTASQLAGAVVPATEDFSPYLRLVSTDTSQDAAVEEANAVAEGLVAYVADFQQRILDGDRERLLADLTRMDDEIKVLETQHSDDSRLEALKELRQSLVKQYEELSTEYLNSGSLEIVSLAEKAAMDPQHPWRNTAIAFIVGAIVGIGIGLGVDSVRKALRRVT